MIDMRLQIKGKMHDRPTWSITGRLCWICGVVQYCYNDVATSTYLRKMK